MNKKEDFWKHIEKTETCWLWRGGLTSTGYGRFYYLGTNSRAHRLCWEALKGKIPDGLELDHLCRIRNCVNPNHLEPVTTVENTMRGNSPAAISARKTHCKYGHSLLDKNNLYKNKRKPTWRICQKCREIFIANRNHKELSRIFRENHPDYYKNYYREKINGHSLYTEKKGN